MHIAKLGLADAGDNNSKLMTKLAPEWVRISDPVIRSPARYRWTTAPATCERWGHIDHDGEDCACLSSDSTEAYVHDLSLASYERDPSPIIEGALAAEVRGEDSGVRGVYISRDCGSAASGRGRPGSVPFVSHRPGAYGRLILAVYVRWRTGLLWHRIGCTLLRGGLADGSTSKRRRTWLTSADWDTSSIRAALGDAWHLTAGARLDSTLLFVWWHIYCCCVLFLRCLEFLPPEFFYCLLLWCHCTDMMDAPSYGSPVRTYVTNQYSMRVSNDVDHSDQQSLSSLGVVDLDLSIMPDVFGLGAFDIAKPFMRMMPGQFPNEIRVMIPDLGNAPEGFHNIVLENLSATPGWRSRRLLPGDATTLCWRWPGVGVSAQSSGPLFLVPGIYCNYLEQTYDGRSFELRTVVAVPGGMVHCLEGVGE